MRVDGVGVTLAMLGFVARLKRRREQSACHASERGAPSGDGGGSDAICSSTAVHRARDPALGTELVSARQQEIALQAALREDAAAVARGRADTFVQEQLPKRFPLDAVMTLEDAQEDEDEEEGEIFNADWGAGLLWSNAALGVKWKVCETMFQNSMEHADIHEIRVAISHARDVAMDEPQLRPALMDMERCIAELRPKELAQHASLLWDQEVVQQLDRFWDATALDLLRSQNHTARGRWGQVHNLLVSKRGAVTLTGYIKLHARVSRAMHRGPGPWNHAATVEHGNEEWYLDVARFGGQAALNAWFSKVKKLLVARSQLAVRDGGWRSLFKTFDRDGSGSLDCNEFVSGIRLGAKVSQHTVKDVELRRVFRLIDRDGSGRIDVVEFLKWIDKSNAFANEPAVHVVPTTGLAPTVSNDAKVVARTVNAMQAAATQTVAQLGWSRVFSKFDFNDDGSLSKGEFTRAVRAECQLSAQELADEELWLVFDMIDVDQSGTIDAAEFVLALLDDTGKEDLVLSVTGFRMCLIELADAWVEERTPEQYVQFLKTLFGHVTEGTGKEPGGLVLGSAAGMNNVLRDISTIPVGAMWQHVATDDSQPGQNAQNPHREATAPRTSAQRQRGRWRSSERVALALNTFGNHNIIEEQLDDAALELQNRMADYGGGMVPRRGLARVDRVAQARLQSNGGGRAAFSLKENQGQQMRLAPRAPFSPRWGLKAQAPRPQSARPHSTRPQSARDSSRPSYAHGTDDYVSRRPQSAREARAMPNRHAIASGQCSIRARARADGNMNIRAARPPRSHTTSRTGDHTGSSNSGSLAARADQITPRDIDTVETIKLRYVTSNMRRKWCVEVAAVVEATRHKANPPQRDAKSGTETASAQVVEDDLKAPSPFGHAWRESVAVQLNRNQLLANRAKVAADAGPVVGRARAPPRDRDPVATTHQQQPKAAARIRPQSAAARMTAAKATSQGYSDAARRIAHTTSPMSQVQPSSAAVLLQQRPQSAGTVLTHARRPNSAGGTRAPATTTQLRPRTNAAARPVSASPRVSSTGPS